MGPLVRLWSKPQPGRGKEGVSIIHTQKLGTRKEGEGEVLQSAAAPTPSCICQAGVTEGLEGSSGLQAGTLTPLN